MSDSASVPPLTIVLLGGIASGKSTVASLLAQRGAVVLDADRIAHEELERAEVVAAVHETWGDAVLDSGGRVDRKKLGAVVFADPAQLKKLEAFVHPRVLARIASRLRELAAPPGDGRRVAVLDVPLASETEMARTADLSLFVDASLETRSRRARELRQWPPGELERREARQLSVEHKRAMADAVVRNDLGVAEAEADVERFWTSLVEPRIKAPR